MIERGDTMDGRDSWLDVKPSHPVKSYVNELLRQMVEEGRSYSELRSTEALPLIREEPFEIPAFEACVNRLKVMSGLDPVTYRGAMEGKISMVMRLKDERMHRVAVRTRFEEGAAGAVVGLWLNRLD